MSNHQPSPYSDSNQRATWNWRLFVERVAAAIVANLIAATLLYYLLR